jgi:hypothetical protein
MAAGIFARFPLLAELDTRSICTGSNLADLSLFFSIAMTLHVFDITPIT